MNFRFQLRSVSETNQTINEFNNKKMNKFLFKVSSQDNTFLDFYGVLAQSLQSSGTVYVPYPLIAPHARMAPPPITNVLVTFKSLENIAIIESCISSYLKRFKEGILHFENANGHITIAGANMTDLYQFRHKLFPVGGSEDLQN